MVAIKTRSSKLLIASSIVVLFLIGTFVGAVYTFQTANNANVMPEELSEPEPVEDITEPEPTGTRLKAGELKWSIQIADEELSTPAICDLNPSPGGGEVDWEVVVGSAANMVAAVNKNGDLFWDPGKLPGQKFTDCVIDNAHVLAQGLDFDPAPFFSSITPVDLTGGPGAELLIGEQDGVLCLNSDGTKYWSDKGITNGYYFSSIAVTDLEGDFQGIDEDGNDVGYRDDLEIILGSDNNANADAFIECWKANGNDVFRYEVDVPFEHAFMTCSIVATELDGYFQGDEERLEDLREADPNGRPGTLWADFLMSTHAYCGRIWKHVEGGSYNEYHEFAHLIQNGHWDSHETYATPAVGNFTGGPELECIIGHGSGMPTWQGSDGTVRMYRQDGSEVVGAYTTGPSPSSVFSSPAACDAQNLDEKDLDEDEVIEYEVFFGCDNGVFYGLSATDLSELWSYQTGGRILSSPAILNIDSDDSMEVVVGSNDGVVYCFECDPMEYDRDGDPNPKDDGIEDGGGEAGTYDILWTFDTKTITGASGEIGISSPVVGDLDRDGQLEVIIGDTGGMLYAISAGGTCVPGQVDWPMFHGDANKTGFYNPGTSYGVRVDRAYNSKPPNPGPEKLKKSAKPGETVQYNVTVTNIGVSKTYTEMDTFWLEIGQEVLKFGERQDIHGWAPPVLTGEKLLWGIHNEELKPYVVLRSMERTNLTIFVTAPWSGDLAESCRVELRAFSANDTFARDNIMTETILELSLDFEVEILKEPVQDTTDPLFGQKVVKINPADKATIEFYVKNKGTLNDSYDLKIEGVLLGWNAYFTESNSPLYLNAFQLDAQIMEAQFPSDYHGSEGVTKFTIEAPEDAQENEILTLKIVANSRYSKESPYIENITKFDYLIIEVNPIPDLELKCREPRKYVDAGGDVTFKVEVINRGNSEIDVRLEHSQLEEGWTLEFQTDENIPITGLEPTVGVVKEGQTTVLVILSAPSYAEADSRQNVIIRGTTTGDAALVSTDSVALTAIVSHTYNINVTVTPPYDEDKKYNIATNPGTTITYNITVDNEGNGEDIIIIKPMVLEMNWRDYRFILDNQEVMSGEPVRMQLHESVVFSMEIKIPIGQLAGTFPTSINITSLGDREVADFHTKINKVFNLSVYGMVRSQHSTDKELNSTIQPDPGVSPGSILNYVFEVTNGGNDDDWINVHFDPLKPTGTQEGDLSIAEWEDYEILKWEAYFVGITNTEAYMTDVEDIDFGKKVDISHETGPVGYLNDGNTTIRTLQLHLGVGQKVWLKVQMRVPRDLPDTHDELHPIKDAPWYFKVNCSSADPAGRNKDINLEDDLVMMKLWILLPDLEVKGKKVNHPSSFDSGEIVTISAQIRNIGAIEAKEVIVTFYVDGKEIRSQTINILEKGQSRLVPFTWEAASGDHDLKIVVDPEDAIVEDNEENNEGTADVGIQTGGIIEILSNREFCSILPIIIVIIILAIIIIIIKKRGSFLGLKPGGGE